MFRSVDDGVVFLPVVLTAAAEELAVFVPAYYDLTDVEDLQAAVRNGDGTLTTHVRKLERGERVEFCHEDPAPFFHEDLGDVP